MHTKYILATISSFLHFQVSSQRVNKETMMSSDNGLHDEEAIAIVSDFLSSWRDVKVKDVQLNKIHGGFLNSVYVIKRAKIDGIDGNNNTDDDNNNKVTEPTKLFIRKTGSGVFDRSNFSEHTIPPVCEVLIAEEVSRRRFGPILYGVFDEGRVEEFLEGHTLTPCDFEDPVINKGIAVAYARFHSIKLPLPKREKTVLPSLPSPSEYAVRKARDMGYNMDIFDIDWNGRAGWLTEESHRINSRVVFCHVDCNLLNIFVRDKPTTGQDKVVLVDYELAGYRYRGFDLGGHFIARMFHWAEKDKVSGSPYPSRKEREAFIKDYLNEAVKLGYINDFDIKGRDSVDHILKETQLGSMMYLFTLCTYYSINMELFVSMDPNFFVAMPLIMETYDKLMKEYKEESKIE